MSSHTPRRVDARVNDRENAYDCFRTDLAVVAQTIQQLLSRKSKAVLDSGNSSSFRNSVTRAWPEAEGVTGTFRNARQ
jgi:hypothetical protein